MRKQRALSTRYGITIVLLYLPFTVALVSKGAFLRATDVIQTTWNGFIAPSLCSIVQNGGSDNFWEQSYKDKTPGQRLTQVLEELGPTYVKFGQALSSRSDIIPLVLADNLATLQDQMTPFDSTIATSIIRDEIQMENVKLEKMLDNMSEQPVAAASIGQVYKAELEGYGPVAIKVKRPGIEKIVIEDAALLKRVAQFIESIPGLPGQDRLIAAKVELAVEEFMTRLFEELDYQKEVSNMKEFAELYSMSGGSSSKVKVVVPTPLDQYCTENCIIMSWIDGIKLSNVKEDNETTRQENLRLIERGIQCTLSQLLDTGLLHSDPHLGNLVKVRTKKGVELGYLDFGILSRVSQRVSDALICAVVYLVFNRDVDAISSLFNELELLPLSVVNDPKRRKALAVELESAFDNSLVYTDNEGNPGSSIPDLRFDNLLSALTSLVVNFEFELPPYFLNNARALGTLEGVARRLDPSFNLLRVLYPYALERLISNPNDSAVVRKTLIDLIYSPETNEPDPKRIDKLVSDITDLTGVKRRKVLLDIAKTKGGSVLFRRMCLGLVKKRRKSYSTKSTQSTETKFLRL